MPTGSIDRLGAGQNAESAQKPIRVLVVDDSALMRKLISQIVSSTPDLEVVATARDGADGLEKAREFQPDVITLDVEMPRMDGLECLEKLMAERPVAVVMVSSLTAEGTETTIACLQRGAVDFVQKPSGSISLDIGKRGGEIAGKIRAAAACKVQTARHAVFSERTQPRHRENVGDTARPHRFLSAPGPNENNSNGHSPNSDPPTTAALTPKVGGSDTGPAIVAIASSTGGPMALQSVLPLLPGDLNAAYIIVQHLPAGFTRSLAERIDRSSAIEVREARPGDRLLAGCALVAPGGLHLEFDSQLRVALNDNPTLWGVRPAADVMMRSVAARFGDRVVGVVMTGMGRDGALGAKAIRESGGFCIGQDEESCVVFGMPRAALEAGGIDETVSLQHIADAIVRAVKTQQRNRSGKSAA